MAKKKVVDADILLEQIQQMSYRSWVPNSYYGGSGYGVNSIEDAMRQTSLMITSRISQDVNVAMSQMINELRMAIERSTRDEDGGMCGLCRVNPDEVLPVDYRSINVNTQDPK